MPEPGEGHERLVTEEFERTAAAFAERTRGRFEYLDAVSFARVGPGETVAEIGAGTGNFLSLFAGLDRRLVAVDLTGGMLRQARARHPGMWLVRADGARLPFPPGSVDLVASAQVLHHVPRPIPFLAEMGRVAGSTGSVLVIDQVATERYEEAVAMNELELLRDPSHAAARPPSSFLVMFEAADLSIVEQRIVSTEQRLSTWMWTDEFPKERIDAVRRFIELRGRDTGMGFEWKDDDWVFERRRIMILATRT